MNVMSVLKNVLKKWSSSAILMDRWSDFSCIQFFFRRPVFLTSEPFFHRPQKTKSVPSKAELSVGRQIITEQTLLTEKAVETMAGEIIRQTQSLLELK